MRSLFAGEPRRAERPGTTRPTAAAIGTAGSEQRVLEDFQKHYGTRFNDPQLLTLALTHRSYLSVTGQGPNDSNERLEFLGDSVLGLVTSEHLYRVHPGQHEGELTKIKSLLVSKNILSRRALNMGLGRFVLMSHSEAESGGRQRLSILADAFESVLGAIYLDQGFEASRRWVHRWLLDDAIAISADKRHTNYKSQLQEYVQSTFHTHPVYRIRNAMGPDHSKMFLVEVVVRNKTLGSGKGNNKKEAEQAAARDALDQVGVARGERGAREGREERPARDDRGVREERPARERGRDRDEAREEREERRPREDRGTREERGAREDRGTREERGAREDRGAREERGAREARRDERVRPEPVAERRPEVIVPPPPAAPVVAAEESAEDEAARRRRGRRGGRGRRGYEPETRPASAVPVPIVSAASPAPPPTFVPEPTEIEPVPPAHEEDENEEVGRPEGPHDDDDIGFFEPEAPDAGYPKDRSEPDPEPAGSDEADDGPSARDWERAEREKDVDDDRDAAELEDDPPAPRSLRTAREGGWPATDEPGGGEPAVDAPAESGPGRPIPGDPPAGAEAAARSDEARFGRRTKRRGR